MKFNFLSSPVFIILSSLVAGILISYFFPSLDYYLIALPFLLSFLAYGSTFFRKFRINDSVLKIERLAFMSLFFIGVGMLAFELHTPSEIKIDGKIECTVSGRVEEVASMTSGDRLLVDIDEITDFGGNRFENPGKAYVTTGATKIRPGDRIQFHAPLSEAGENRNYRRTGSNFLRNRHIYYAAYVDENKIAYGAPVEDLKSKSLKVREKIEIFIEKTSLNGDTKNFLISLLLGDRQAMSRESRESFSEAGISHILAVSGMHIGIISSIILMLLYPLSLFINHKWRFIIAIPLIWLYVWLTGLAPSTVRAAIMISLYFIAIVIERKHNSIEALGWAPIFILIFNPYSLFDIGFQLSFTCVFFLLLMVDELNFVDRQTHPRLYNLTSIFLITIVATLATWSLISLYFQQIVTLFLPANIVIVPFLPIFVALSLIYLVLSAFGVELEFLHRLIDSTFDLGHSFIFNISSMGNVEKLEIGITTVLLWLLGLTLIGLMIRRKEKKKLLWGGSIAVLLLSLVSIPFFREETKPDGFIVQKSFPYITIASYMGQDESIITMPKGRISTFEHTGKRILILDGKIQENGITDDLRNFLAQTDIVVVGSGFNGEDNGLLEHLNKEAVVLMHSSMRKKKERKLTGESFAGRKVYSIRNEGPFESFD